MAGGPRTPPSEALSRRAPRWCHGSMKMPKHSDEAKAHFRSLVTRGPGVEVKPMFGSLGAFVNGNMYAGLFGDDVGVKLDDAGLAELDALPGSGPFGPQERPMGGYRSLPADLPDAEKVAWVERAREHISTLPPKVRKPRG
jgi:TfoX/Sxy family transcriptional regulator of competence genes